MSTFQTSIHRFASRNVRFSVRHKTIGDFLERWSNHLQQAFNNFIHNIDIYLLSLLLLYIDSKKNKGNSQKEQKQRSDLRESIDYFTTNYWLFFVGRNIVEQIGTLSRYGQYESRTAIDYLHALDSYRNNMEVLKDDIPDPILNRVVNNMFNLDEEIIELDQNDEAIHDNNNNNMMQRYQINRNSSLLFRSMYDLLCDTFKPFDNDNNNNNNNNNNNFDEDNMFEDGVSLNLDYSQDILKAEELIETILEDNDNYKQYDYHRLWKEQLLNDPDNKNKKVHRSAIGVHSVSTANVAVHIVNSEDYNHKPNSIQSQINEKKLKRNELLAILLDLIKKKGASIVSVKKGHNNNNNSNNNNNNNNYNMDTDNDIEMELY